MSRGDIGRCRPCFQSLLAWKSASSIESQNLLTPEQFAKLMPGLWAIVDSSYTCITPIIEWFIFCVASCCLSTSEPAAQGFPASNTTWFIICLLCSITFGKVTFLLRNSHIFSVHPKGIINFPKMQCWSCQIMQKNAYMERNRT